MLGGKYILTTICAEGHLQTSNGLNGGGLMEEVDWNQGRKQRKGGDRAFQVEEKAQGKINNEYSHLASSVGK